MDEAQRQVNGIEKSAIGRTIFAGSFHRTFVP